MQKLQLHEPICRDMTIIQDVAKKRILALLHSYEKLGYRISVNYSTNGQDFVTVYHPDYGKIK